VPRNSSAPACRISKLSHSESRLENGIEYCLVEVTCDDGQQYGIQAFGEEAVELHHEALGLQREVSKELSLVL
jgi:hypothetical protein